MRGCESAPTSSQRTVPSLVKPDQESAPSVGRSTAPNSTSSSVVAASIRSAHPQPSENAWLLGQALLKAGLLPTQQVTGMVGARGVAPRHYRVKVRTRVGVGRSALLAATAGQQGCVRRPADRDGRARRREGPAGRVLRQAAWSRSGMTIRSGPTQARSDDLIWRATAESGETRGGPARRRPTAGQRLRVRDDGARRHFRPTGSSPPEPRYWG